MSGELKTGDAAPEFDLPGADGPVSLKALRGKTVVLYFYPKDDTSGCTAEAQGFTAAAADFAAAGAVVVGVSKGKSAGPRGRSSGRRAGDCRLIRIGGHWRQGLDGVKGWVAARPRHWSRCPSVQPRPSHVQ
jgi:hypothetical protein